MHVHLIIGLNFIGFYLHAWKNDPTKANKKFEIFIHRRVATHNLRVKGQGCVERLVHENVMDADKKKVAGGIKVAEFHRDRPCMHEKLKSLPIIPTEQCYYCYEIIRCSWSIAPQARHYTYVWWSLRSNASGTMNNFCIRKPPLVDTRHALTKAKTTSHNLYFDGLIN